MSKYKQALPSLARQTVARGFAAVLSPLLLGLGFCPVEAADSIYVRTPVHFNEDDSSDDALNSIPLHWSDEFPQSIYMFDGPFFDILDPFNNPQGITDSDVLAAATRSVIRWNDAGGDFQWVPFVFSSDFAPVPDPFNSYAVDVRADGFNLITFRDPNIVPGDGVNFVPTVFYFREDFDPAEDGADPTVNIVQLTDTSVAIELDGTATIAAVIFPKPYEAGEIIDADIAMNSVTLGYNLYPEDPDDLGTHGLGIEDTLGTLDIEALMTEVMGRQAGIAPSHLFNATMSQFYIIDGTDLDEFKTNPYERRSLLLDDEMAWQKVYGDDEGGLSGNFFDGAIYDPFFGGSQAVPDLAIQVVYAGQPRLDGQVDLDTVFQPNTRFGITEFYVGPVQLKACALTGRGLLLNLLPSGGTNDPEDNPIFNGINDVVLPPRSDWTLPGLPDGSWYLLGAPPEFSYDADTNDPIFDATFPIEFFGGVDALAPLPGDGNQNSEDDFINTIRSRFVQVAINASLNEDGGEFDVTNGTFVYSYTDGPQLIDGADRNLSVARIVYPDGTVQDFENRTTGFSGPGTILLQDETRDRMIATFILRDRSSAQVGTLEITWVIDSNPALGISDEREIRTTWQFTNTSDQQLKFGFAQLYDIAYGFSTNPVSEVNGEFQYNSVAFGGPAEPPVPAMVEWLSTPSAAVATASLFLNNPADPSITVPNRVLFLNADEARVIHNNIWTIGTTGVLFGPGIAANTGYVVRYDPTLVSPGGSRTITASFTAKLNEDTSSLLGQLLARVENGYPRQTQAEIFADDPPRAFPLPLLGSGVPNINFITNTATRIVNDAIDADGDGVADDADNCPFTPNADQTDDDGDGIGDVCEGDLDGDGIPDAQDNCDNVPNPEQTDTDGDAIGDACDNDSDNDGVPDVFDNCVFTQNPDQADQDGDGVGDVCEGDRDGDGIPDVIDNCPFTPNPDQLDNDQDGIGNVCDTDRDGDGVDNNLDNCPDRFNPGQTDTDGDGVGDACEDGSFFMADVSPATTPLSSAQIPQSDFISSGVASGDLNGDGFVDIVIANAGTGGQTAAGLVNRIYINQGSSGRPGFFQDLTFGIDGIINNADDRLGFRTSVDDPPGLVQDITHDVILFDMDLDGDLDIYFCNRGLLTGTQQGGSTSRIMINLDVDDPTLNPNADSDSVGDGFFRDVNRFANPGVLNFGAPDGIPADLTGPFGLWLQQNGIYIESRGKAADIDADGDLDLVLSGVGVFDDASAALPTPEPPEVPLTGYLPADLTPDITPDDGSLGDPTEPFDTALFGLPLFSERVLINRRDELQELIDSNDPDTTPDTQVRIEIGRADAFLYAIENFPLLYDDIFPKEISAEDITASRYLDAFWFRDETLGRDGIFGGSSLNQDRIPPIFPDVSPTTTAAEIDIALSNTREVIVAPLNPFPIRFHSALGGGIRYAPDIFVANGPAPDNTNTPSADEVLSNMDFRNNELAQLNSPGAGEPTAYQFNSQGPIRDRPVIQPGFIPPSPDFIPDGVFYSMRGGTGPMDRIPQTFFGIYDDETDVDPNYLGADAPFFVDIDTTDQVLSSTLLVTIPDGKTGDFNSEGTPSIDYDDFPTEGLNATAATVADFRASGGGTIVSITAANGIQIFERFQFDNTTVGIRTIFANVSRAQDGFFLGGIDPAFQAGTSDDRVLQITSPSSTEPAFQLRTLGGATPEGRARAIVPADFNRDGGIDFAYISDGPEGADEGSVTSSGGILSIFSNTDQLGGLNSSNRYPQPRPTTGYV